MPSIVLHTIAIKLKIPDNTAHSALGALQRLGVDVASVERADIWQFDSNISADELVAGVQRNELLFNPNKHILEVLDEAKPRAAEAWIGELNPASHPFGAKHFTSWRLFDAAYKPVDKQILAAAVEKLLCNPAIERAITSE